MTPDVGIRVLLVAAAVVTNVALAFARGPADLVWIHPVAPPLTHIPEMGEPVLSRGSAQASSPPDEAPPPGAARMPPGPPGGAPRGPPPLRGLAGMVERVVQATGTPKQRASVAGLRAGTDARGESGRAMGLRVAIEDDAVALATALGPERVGAILAAKDDLSTRVGEGRAWAGAIERVER